MGFDVLYKQAVTVFNRVRWNNDEVLWYPTFIRGVHLIIDKSDSWDMNGGHAQDNARLHIRYRIENGKVMIGNKQYLEPKMWRNQMRPEEYITFGHGDAELFDFFMEGAFDLQLYPAPISDALFERKGFYNYMNATYDNVFAITGVSKFNLIPHFEIAGR